jgi:hypothetical protein
MAATGLATTPRQICLAAVAVLIIAIVYSATSGASSLAQQFFDRLGKNEPAAAYELTSARFRSKIDLVRFNRFIREQKLDQVTTAFWYERFIYGSGNDAWILLSGTVTRRDRTTGNQSMRFTKLGGAWQIDSITSGAPGDAIPDDREVTGPVSNTPGPTSKPK